MAVGIIGSGIIGLSTGVELQKRGYEVTIYTKDLPKDVDSNAACAIWLPFSGGPKTDVPEKEKEWVEQSWKVFKNIDENTGDESGLEIVELVECLENDSEDNPYFAEIVEQFETGTVEGPSGAINCWKIRTYVIEMPKYLPYLKNRFLSGGGKIVEKTIKYEDINNLPESVVFNCAGIGAKNLFKDGKLKPVKGEVLLHDEVNIDKAIGDGKFCLIPRSDALVIGAQWKEGVENRTHDDAWADKTLNKANKWADSPLGEKLELDKNYNSDKIYGYVTGIRPHRNQVRIEREVIDDTSVYHNYGHGGSGVTLSWGCAIDVVNMFEKNLLTDLNNINITRQNNDTVHVSIEIAHTDMSPINNSFERTISKSTEKVKDLLDYIDDEEISYNILVLIDHKAMDVGRDQAINKLLGVLGNNITVDYICFESDLEELLSDVKPMLHEETIESIQGYIGNNGHMACSHDILIWYCLRLGLIKGNVDIVTPISDRAKSNSTPFISNKNISILREGVSKHEEWAIEYLQKSFPAEVVAAASNNIYYSIN